MNDTKNKIIILVGPSASGKSTISKYAIDLGGQETVSATTREPRIGEVNGKDYYFFRYKTFLEKVYKNEFVEYEMFNNEFYGTLKEEFEEKLKKGNIFSVLEPKGAVNIKRLFGESVYVFFLDGPNDLLKNRMISRGDKEEDIMKRINILEETRNDMKLLFNEKDLKYETLDIFNTHTSQEYPVEYLYLKIIETIKNK